MSQTPQLIPQLTMFFYAIGYLTLAVFVCIAFYKYVAAAVETRSIFHTRIRMVVPLAVLFIGPRMALRQFDLPKSVASGLETMSTLALLVILVVGLRTMIRLFSHGERDMSGRGWCRSPFDQRDELSFKRVPEGWIFRAPNPWLFGPGRHYLIDQAQRSELSAHLRQVWRALDRAIAIIVVVIVAITVPGAPLINEHPVIIFCGLLVGAAAAAFVVAHLAVTHMSRAVLGDLQPTTLRSTQGTLERQLEIYSRGWLAYNCLSSLALFAVFALLSSRGSSGWDLFSLFGALGALLLGSGTIYWFVLYIAKARSER